MSRLNKRVHSELNKHTTYVVYICVMIVSFIKIDKQEALDKLQLNLRIIESQIEHVKKQTTSSVFVPTDLIHSLTETAE
jgi:hypothetical protein